MSKSETNGAPTEDIATESEANEVADQVFDRLRGYLDDLSKEPMPAEMLRLVRELESIH